MPEQTRLPDPILVDNPQALQRLGGILACEARLAVDTESNSLYAYREQVCLLQFSTPDFDYLVDPLALADLSPLAPIFANPHIEKIFHAAEYDVICLKRDFDFQFANLFDTMLAARILGWESLGLGSILAQEFDLQLNKRYQRANWGQRPLPPDLLSYARLDTRYLLPLRDQLKAALEGNGRWALAEEDFQRLCQLDRQEAPLNGSPDCWRVSGAHDLTAQQCAVLWALCEYRERTARAINRPLFKVIGDKTLAAIAVACPATLEELQSIYGMSPGQVRRHGRRLLQAVRRGLAAKPLYPPRPQRRDELTLARLEALRDWRKETAHRWQVESDVILPKDLMQEIAQQNPNHPEALQAVLEDSPWRLEQFGSQILAALKPRSNTEDNPL